MKIITIMPVKNEEWILEKTLGVLSLFCDHIIVGDQGSWDQTPEICQKFSKVVYVKQPAEYMSGKQNRRQILLDRAREFGADNFIFCFDADEIPTANILDNQPFWQKIPVFKPGQSLQMEWITLWKSPFVFRQDQSVWSGQRRLFGFKDDGKTNFPPGDLHEGRVPLDFGQNPVIENGVKVLHFHFVLFSRMLSKQAHCRVKEYNAFGRNPFFINFRYGITKEERGLKTQKTPEVWYEAYFSKGISFEGLKPSGLYWYDVEILWDFKKFGADKYRFLDIWDLPWEEKRRQALALGYEGLPEQPVSDPRPLMVKFYHWGLNKIDIQFLGNVYIYLKRLLGLK